MPGHTGTIAHTGRFFAIGLPIVVVLLMLVVANQIGGVLIARDLRDNYASLVAEGREVLNQAQPPAQDAAPAAQPATPPDVRPEVTVAVSLTEFEIQMDTDEIPAWAVVDLRGEQRRPDAPRFRDRRRRQDAAARGRRVRDADPRGGR